MAEYSGLAEPERILPLLWRREKAAPNGTTDAGQTPPAAGEARAERRGRPARLTVDAVVAAAVALADAEDLAAASMARVAAALGVGTMTLYTYVPSRAELVDLMVDEVLLRRELPGPGEPRPDGWRDQVRLYADRTLATYRAHPWLGTVSTVRPPIGPGMLAEREYVLSTVAGLGLSARDTDTAALAIQAFVAAAGRQQGESALLARRTGQSTDSWWHRRGQLWEEYFDVERYPTLTRLWQTGELARGTQEQAADAYALGLRLLLDGISPG